MSYSYIENVFPSYKSSKVYDDSLYTKTNNNNNIKLEGYNEGYSNGSNIEHDLVYLIKPQVNNQTQVPVQAPVQAPVQVTEGFQNNLAYYNLPINKPNYILENLTNINDTQNIQNTQNNNTQQHVELQHVLNCDQCKKILMKQFNIESDRIKHEEIIELISYIMFGLFILYLIDSLK